MQMHFRHRCQFCLLQNCSTFQAGSTVRSKSKAAKLDVNAVFGSACRHEFPQLFMNMRHGERYNYIFHLHALQCLEVIINLECRI
jgi:Kyakuja-Dileera-Zisupton transposase